MSLLYISSSHRQEDRDIDSSNFTINLKHTYTGVRKARLILYNIPNSIFNIRMGVNDCLVITLPVVPTPWTENPYVDENLAKNYLVKLDEGFYSLKDLQNAIQLKSQEVFTNDGRSENIKIELDELTNRLTFTEENDLLFRINGGHPSYNFDSELVGLPANFIANKGRTTWNKTIKMPNSVNVALKTIFLTILFNDSTGYDCMSADGNIFASFVVPIDNVYSAIVFGRADNTVTFSYPMSISRLRIQWADYKGRPLKMDLPWELILSLS